MLDDVRYSSFHGLNQWTGSDREEFGGYGRKWTIFRHLDTTARVGKEIE